MTDTTPTPDVREQKVRKRIATILHETIFDSGITADILLYDLIASERAAAGRETLEELKKVAHQSTLDDWGEWVGEKNAVWLSDINDLLATLPGGGE